MENEQQIIRDLTITPIMLDKETFEPFYRVQMSVYSELAQDIRVYSGSEQEQKMIGKQLCEAVVAARMKL